MVLIRAPRCSRANTSSDTSSRRSGKERCRFSKKIPLRGHPRQPPTPTLQHVRANTQFRRNLTDVHAWGLQDRHGLTLAFR